MTPFLPPCCCCCCPIRLLPKHFGPLLPTAPALPNEPPSAAPLLAALELQCPPPSHQHTPAHTPFHCENDNAAPLFLSPGRRHPARSIPRAPRCAPAAALRRHQMPGEDTGAHSAACPTSPSLLSPFACTTPPISSVCSHCIIYTHNKSRRRRRGSLGRPAAGSAHALLACGRGPLLSRLDRSSPFRSPPFKQLPPAAQSGAASRNAPQLLPPIYTRPDAASCNAQAPLLLKNHPPFWSAGPALAVSRARTRVRACALAVEAKSSSFSGAVGGFGRHAVVVAAHPPRRPPFFVGLFLLSFFSLLPSLSLLFPPPCVAGAAPLSRAALRLLPHTKRSPLF